MEGADAGGLLCAANERSCFLVSGATPLSWTNLHVTSEAWKSRRLTGNRAAAAAAALPLPTGLYQSATFIYNVRLPPVLVEVVGCDSAGGPCHTIYRVFIHLFFLPPLLSAAIMTATQRVVEYTRARRWIQASASGWGSAQWNR